ncbi:cupin domain-containing protein [Mangrovihabitans endophyticus]|uniref:Cupin n=1 Tax=Mangrovihabitans endophyticus TaxID=1751298 RepID=A0A8J3FMC2_9ACTN|nr:cupin domain-containing protein [Mangrovihabitans endophyticus]GGK74889.1 cupin [Mangrovihabitans endophyticus]
MTGSDHHAELAPLFATLQRMDLQPVIDRADHPWFNQTLVQVGDVLVRLGVFQPGTFHWHQHDEQDEFFLVLDGRLRIDLDGHDPVDLGPWQAFSVPAGLRHCPTAVVASTVLMMERADVVPAGD